MALRIDEIGFGGYKLMQNPEEFCYGVDAVLLADMAAGCGRFTKAADLGTGTGIIPLILCSKNPDVHVTGYDVVEGNVLLARKNSALNRLEERLYFVRMDVADIPEEVEKECVDIVTCNPPYFRRGGGIVNDNSARFIARQETTADVFDFAGAAAHLLVERGHFCMIHRPDRLVDIMCACRKYRLEPKEIRMIAPRENAVPNMVLVHCIKGAGRELKVIPTLNVYKNEKKGGYSEEILKIYGRNEL